MGLVSGRTSTKRLLRYPFDCFLLRLRDFTGIYTSPVFFSSQSHTKCLLHVLRVRDCAKGCGHRPIIRLCWGNRRRSSRGGRCRLWLDGSGEPLAYEVHRVHAHQRRGWRWWSCRRVGREGARDFGHAVRVAAHGHDVQAVLGVAVLRRGELTHDRVPPLGLPPCRAHPGAPRDRAAHTDSLIREKNVVHRETRWHAP
jgi:hypothetical protein